MPAKHSVKTYVADSIYHIYNRGVEKRNIFLDHQDYTVFLRFLKDSLTPTNTSKIILQNITFKGRTFQGIPKQPKNFHEAIVLLAYCLMPNHFHFIVHQQLANHMQEFMQSIMTRYSIYFNNKYKRVGSLFQGKYKAVLVNEEGYLLHLSRYIHRNPLTYTKDLIAGYSSYAEYLRLKQTKWVKPDIILSFFQPATLLLPKKINSYESFVNYDKTNSEEILGSITLEN